MPVTPPERRSLSFAVKEGHLGVTLADTDTGTGVCIEDLCADDLIAKAGLKVDDVILSVNGDDVNDHASALAALNNGLGGKKIVLEYWTGADHNELYKAMRLERAHKMRWVWRLVPILFLAVAVAIASYEYNTGADNATQPVVKSGKTGKGAQALEGKGKFQKPMPKDPPKPPDPSTFYPKHVREQKKCTCDAIKGEGLALKFQTNNLEMPHKFKGGAVFDENTVILSPARIGYVGILNVRTRQVSISNVWKHFKEKTVASDGSNKYNGAVVVDGKAYFVPCHEHGIGVWNKVAHDSEIGDPFYKIDVRGIAGEMSGYKYAGGTAIGTTVVMAPQNLTHVAVLDTVTDALRAVDLSEYLFKNALFRYSGAVTVGELAYFVPAGERAVGIFNPKDDSFRTIDVPIEGRARGYLYDGAAVMGTTIYFSPSARGPLAWLDTTTEKFQTLERAPKDMFAFSGAAVVGTTVFYAPKVFGITGMLDTTTNEFSLFNISITSGETEVEETMETFQQRRTPYSGIVALDDTAYIVPHSVADLQALQLA